MRRRHLPHRRAADGRRDPQGDGRERLRSARLRAVRLRRRRARRTPACSRASSACERSIVPQRKAASTWCAFGAAAADVLHIFEHSEIMATPVPAKRINDVLDRLADEGGKARWRAKASPRAAPALRVLARRAPQGPDQRGRGAAAVGALCRRATSRGCASCSCALRAALRPRLGARRRAARDRRLPPARARADAAAETGRRKKSRQQEPIPRGAKRTTRSIYWPDLKKYRATPVFDGDKLLSGNRRRARRSSRPRTPRWWCIPGGRSGSTRWATSRSLSRGKRWRPAP